MYVWRECFFFRCTFYSRFTLLDLATLVVVYRYYSYFFFFLSHFLFLFCNILAPI